VQVWLGFVEVPPQRCPEHHGDLACERGHGLEVGRRRVDYVRDVEGVAVQGWGSEAGEMVIVVRAIICCALFILVYLLRFLGVDDDCPAWGEGGVVLHVEIGGFEGDPTENGRYIKGEAIGQVAGGVPHCGRACLKLRNPWDSCALNSSQVDFFLLLWPLTARGIVHQ